LKGFIAGGAGGVSSVVIGYPLDTAKVRLQTAVKGAYNGVFDVLYQSVRIDGIRGIYRGISAPLVSITPICAVYFWGFEMGKDLAEMAGMTNPDGCISTAGLMFAGGFSAIPGTCLMTPGDRVKVLLQAADSKFKHPWAVCCHLWKSGGITAFYKGTSLTLLRDVPGSVIYYGGYELLKSKAAMIEGNDCSKLSTTSILICGGTAGCLGWMYGVAPDTIKSRIQSAAPGQYPGGAVEVVREIFTKEGVLGIYRGLGAALMRAFPANAACFWGYEKAMGLLNQFQL